MNSHCGITQSTYRPVEQSLPSVAKAESPFFSLLPKLGMAIYSGVFVGLFLAVKL